jgi:hypothetical protein
MLGLTIAIFQNLGNSDIYTLGSFSCDVPSTFLVFIVKVIYILFWTWILNLICKDGRKMISWLLVLFPFILSFGLITLFMIEREGFFVWNYSDHTPEENKAKMARIAANTKKRKVAFRETRAHKKIVKNPKST